MACWRRPKRVLIRSFASAPNLLWEQAGRPDGCADDFWHQAQHQRFCERAYAMWERAGCPEGKADEHWVRTRAFEES
jgi:hypothetical protein